MAANPSAGARPAAEQPALHGLAVHKRSRTAKKTPAQPRPAGRLPVARVVVDVQAPHLGWFFDYLVSEKDDTLALPGTRVRVRFGGRLTNGVVWKRAEKSDTPSSRLRFLDRVLADAPRLGREYRRCVEAIARFFGGTLANVLRLAVPPRVAGVETERPWADLGVGATERRQQTPVPPAAAAELEAATRRELDGYSGIRELLDALDTSPVREAIWDALPGPDRWASDVAWLIIAAQRRGRGAVTVLPGRPALLAVQRELTRWGFSQYAVFDSADKPEVRYRSFCAVSAGIVTCAIGTRAAMYAPVSGPSLFLAVDDNVYQNSDGLAPYANVHDVLRVRAKEQHGLFVSMAFARSAVLQKESEDTGVLEIHPLDAALSRVRPRLRWLSPDAARAAGDATAFARIPHVAVAVLAKAVETGPALVVVPMEGFAEVLACASCHRQARCRRCDGPLRREGGAAPVCAWCGASAGSWECPGCGGRRLLTARLGTQGTAQDLANLVRGVPIVVVTKPASGTMDPPVVADAPVIVVAPPGALPRVAPPAGSDGRTNQAGHADRGGNTSRLGYRCCIVLDPWAVSSAGNLDAREDALEVWMSAAALVVPAEQGGQAILAGDCDPDMARSFVAWDARILARADCDERRELRLPPFVAAASVWGGRQAVEGCLDAIGARGGDLSLVDGVPSVMGPVPIPGPETERNRALSGVADRVRAIVRVSETERGVLVERLSHAVAEHSRKGNPGELRFWVDPKDLRHR